MAYLPQRRNVPANRSPPLSADHGGDLDPDFWSISSGLERAIEESASVLFLPVMNGGEGGEFIKPGVHRLLANAVNVIYSQSHLLVAETIDVRKAVLMAFSQSGGNVFSAAGNDPMNIRGLVLLEPQYMNEWLRNEDKRLKLGREVIPVLLENRATVVVVGRYRERPRKYLPEGRANGIVTLPDAANYHVLSYPLPSGKVASLHPLIARRYARLLDSADVVRTMLLSEDEVNEDAAVVNQEAKVEDVLDRYRAKGMSLEAIIRAVFPLSLEPDAPGRYYPHSVTLTGGQELDVDGKSHRSFLHEGLRRIPD
jgi:hypothetical protein